MKHLVLKLTDEDSDRLDVIQAKIKLLGVKKAKDKLAMEFFLDGLHSKESNLINIEP